MPRQAELYWRASEAYREGQHAIFADDNAEKIYLHGKQLGVLREGRWNTPPTR